MFYNSSLFFQVVWGGLQDSERKYTQYIKYSFYFVNKKDKYFTLINKKIKEQLNKFLCHTVN